MKKQKLTLEYRFSATTQSIFRAVSSSNGLAEWFADRVDITGNIYEFFWGKSTDTALIISLKENHHIRLHWSSESVENYFEFKIIKHELTGDNTLIITDFIDPDDVKDATELWNNQVEKLKRSIGCPKN